MWGWWKGRGWVAYVKGVGAGRKVMVAASQGKKHLSLQGALMYMVEARQVNLFRVMLWLFLRV